MKMSRKITLGDFLTNAEIAQAARIWEMSAIGTFATECENQIIKPNIERINKSLGQENDTRFLAHCVEFALMQLHYTETTKS